MNGQKRFNEYFAKVILEYCCKDRYSDLEISDKPDLRNKRLNIGIEVAYSMEQDRVEALNLKRLLPQANEEKSLKIQRSLDKIRKRHNNPNYESEYNGKYEKDIEVTYLKEIFDCVRKKVEKLNNANANYAVLDSYELFINSAVPIDKM